MVQELRRRQKIKQALYSWPAIGVFLVLAILMAKGAIGLMMIERKSAYRVDKLEAEAQSLSVRRDELKGEIGRLGTEEGVMEEIRDKFSVARPGEHVAIIVDDRKGPTTTESWAEDWYTKIVDAIIFWK